MVTRHVLRKQRPRKKNYQFRLKLIRVKMITSEVHKGEIQAIIEGFGVITW